MRKVLKNCLSLAMVFSLVYVPVGSQYAYATSTSDDFHQVCDKSLQDIENKKSTQGDQVMAYCEQADLARQGKNVETVKTVVYLTAATACTVLAALIAACDATVVGAGASAGYATACTLIGIGAGVAGLGTDIAGKAIINNSKEKYGQAKDQICSVQTFAPLVMSLAPMVLSGGGLVTKAAVTSTTAADGTTSTTASVASNTGCILCAIMNGLTGAASLSSSTSSKDAQKKFVEDAKGVKDASNTAVNELSSMQMIQQQPSNQSKHASGGSGSGTTPSTDSCSDKNGDQYLSCMGTMSPEIAALSNSPEFLSEIKKSLHGKNLGDFVKGYKGESNADLANYVAAGLGVSPSVVSSVMKNNDKMAKDTNFIENYTPMAYARKGGTAPKVSDDLDFGKLMAGMMGKMDPNAGKDGKGGDPSELVFRQLELLPPESIQANKDISLFARIAFRYRKNATNVEQLNWSRQENQDAQSQKK